MKPHYRWLYLLVAIAVILGIVFRFTNLESRAYWHDEAYTLLRISGHIIPDVTQPYFNGTVTTIQTIQQFQTIYQNHGISETISALIREDQHHPPIYYVMSWLWMDWFGNSIQTTRLLPSLISAISIPCMFWLCWELFETQIAAWIGMGLMAISPFQVYYAQEIREYGLWSLIVVIACATLIRAMKRNTEQAWMIYAIASVASLYSALFSCFVLFGHGVYVLILEGFRFTQRTRRFLLTALFTTVAFLPWVWVFFNNLATISSLTSWMKLEVTKAELLKKWIYNLQSVFLEPFKVPDSVRLTSALLITLLLIYAVVCVIRFSPMRVWLLILCLIVPVSVSLLGADFILGGMRSSNSRYFVPAYIGAQLSLTFLLSHRLITTNLRTFAHQRWAALTAVLLLAGLLTTSYHTLRRGVSEQQAIAQIINASDRPLLVSGEQSYRGGGTVGDILALSNILKPEVQVQLVIQPNVPEVPTNLGDTYLYKPLPYLLNSLKQQFTVESVYGDSLFRLSRKP